MSNIVDIAKLLQTTTGEEEQAIKFLTHAELDNVFAQLVIELRARDNNNCKRCWECSNCTSCYRCWRCRNCRTCMFCAELSNAQYCILNIQFSKHDYTVIRRGLLKVIKQYKVNPTVSDTQC